MVVLVVWLGGWVVVVRLWWSGCYVTISDIGGRQGGKGGREGGRRQAAS